MPAKNGKVITVDPEFAKMIDDGLLKTNELLEKKLKKRMTKIDYTNFLSHIMRNDFGIFLTHSMIQPIKKGRKSKRVMFDL
jgi:phage baseplate assembly protein W